MRMRSPGLEGIVWSLDIGYYMILVTTYGAGLRRLVTLVNSVFIVNIWLTCSFFSKLRTAVWPESLDISESPW